MDLNTKSTRRPNEVLVNLQSRKTSHLLFMEVENL